jgi:hypothetical protein
MGPTFKAQRTDGLVLCRFAAGTISGEPLAAIPSYRIGSFKHGVSGSSPPRPSAVQAEADGTGELLVTRTQLEAETARQSMENPLFLMMEWCFFSMARIQLSVSGNRWE